MFKVNKGTALRKIKREIQKVEKENLLTGFTHTKEDGLYVKVKKQHIKKFFKFKFEKEKIY